MYCGFVLGLLGSSKNTLMREWPMSSQNLMVNLLDSDSFLDLSLAGFQISLDLAISTTCSRKRTTPI